MHRRPVARAVARAVAVAVALAVLVLRPDVALAHASFDVRQIPAGSSQQLVLRVPLERDAANDLVEVLVPGAFTVDACDGAAGWSCQQEPGAEGGTALTFQRTPDGAGDAEHFGVTITAPEDEGVYPFPTIQTYDDGEEVAWIGEPGSDRPAPRIQVGDETAPVEPAGDPPAHTATADDEPAGTSTPTPETADSPSGSVTAAPTEIPSDPAVDDADEDAGDGEVAVGGAGLAIAAALVVVVAVVAAAAVLLLRRRGR